MSAEWFEVEDELRSAADEVLEDVGVPLERPGDICQYVCNECRAEVERPSGRATPSCGQTTTDLQRFPDGGWVRTEFHVPHGKMRLVGMVTGSDANPFAEMAVQGDEEE